MKILLMEDDPVLSDILQDFLQESWQVDYAFNSEEVYKNLESKSYELFIFDINVAGKDGLELLKELREFNNTTPAMIITAYADTSYLKRAFEIGINDYIKKPFELEELSIRITNIQKLLNLRGSAEIDIKNDIRFLPELKKLYLFDKPVSLSTKDSALLLYFINNPKKLISSDELIQNIWSYDSTPSDATIRSHIRTLRKLIGKDSIKTIRGDGYIYE